MSGTMSTCIKERLSRGMMLKGWPSKNLIAQDQTGGGITFTFEGMRGEKAESKEKADVFQAASKLVLNAMVEAITHPVDGGNASTDTVFNAIVITFSKASVHALSKALADAGSTNEFTKGDSCRMEVFPHHSYSNGCDEDNCVCSDHENGADELFEEYCQATTTAAAGPRQATPKRQAAVSRIDRWAGDRSPAGRAGGPARRARGGD